MNQSKLLSSIMDANPRFPLDDHLSYSLHRPPGVGDGLEGTGIVPYSRLGVCGLDVGAFGRGNNFEEFWTK